MHACATLICLCKIILPGEFLELSFSVLCTTTLQAPMRWCADTVQKWLVCALICVYIDSLNPNLFLPICDIDIDIYFGINI